jgi:hypothetical protein
VGITDEDYDDDFDPDDDWYDDEPWREPDPEDYEQARADEEYAEHCAEAHGGAPCDCRPPALSVLRWTACRQAANAWHAVRVFTRDMHTVRVGPVELTVRFRPRGCDACGGRGWFYTKGTVSPVPMPEGYDSAALCGCGSAITRLAESRRSTREARHEPPF